MESPAHTPQNNLENEIAQLRENIARLNSFRFTFLRGLVGGVAYALGATLIAGLLIAALWQVLQSVETLPILNKLLDVEALREALMQQPR